LPNIYLITALFATLIDAVYRKADGHFLLAQILPIKPHWAFAAAVPLLLEDRF
jgi:hypothetical protein